MTLEEAYASWLAIQPLSERNRNRLSKKFTVEYNYNSNHIEGNTLTYGQTELLLLFGRVNGDSNIKDFNDMKASRVGLEMMQEEACNKTVPLTQNFIRTLHKTILREDYKVYRNLPGGVYTSYVIHAGQYKTRPNSVITRYGDRFDYASPEETPALMTDLVDWYNEAEQSGKYTPVELAALFHYRYIRIHPFEDGNGRIARLMVNYILTRHDWPMIVVRSRKKKEYLEALHKTDLSVGTTPSKGSHATLRQINHFLKYFKKLVATEIASDVEFIRNDNPNEWWYDGEKIKSNSKNAGKLLSALSDDPYMKYSEIVELLNINKSAVQRLIKTMTEKGYLSRIDNEAWHVFAVR